jgi:DNA-binding NarL/FixJ family response regulator
VEARRKHPESVRAMVVLVGDWPAVPTGVHPVEGGPRAVRRVAADARRLRAALASADPEWLLFGALDEWAIRGLLASALSLRPQLRIAMIGPSADCGRCSRWMRRGCHVYLDEGATLERMLLAMEVASTQRIIVIDRVFQEVARAQQVQPVGSLTRREEEVLRLLCLGLRNSDIANALHLTENTVEFHVSRLLAKLGVRNRVEAAGRAFALGLA